MDGVENPIFRYRQLWLAIGYAMVLVVIYLSLTSEPVMMTGLFAFEDKFYHALAYFGLMAWFGQIYHQRRLRTIIALLFMLLGLSMEYLQSFNPERYAEFDDMVANVAGVALGLLLVKTSARFWLLRIEQQLPGASS